ncbi:MAG: hypothetical protein M1818_008538 [Claussenomyces sp. TS43310]|nr:MAG: hypothetical protein M1818_008538 [Claussenomyces sp. TS43310]
MFQSFTGSSRRPRQVNLSGQNIDPFAPSAWAPDAAGARKSVAAAQHERQQRQLERDRINATKRIQRVWRGRKVRSSLKDSRRAEWDAIVEDSMSLHGPYLAGLPDELRLLLSFCDSHKSEDIKRLRLFGDRVILVIGQGNQTRNISEIGSDRQLSKLASSILESLFKITPKFVDRYYEVIRSLVGQLSSVKLYGDLLLDALRYPLIEHIDIDNSRSMLSTAYGAFATRFLTTPYLSDYLGGLQALSAVVDIDILSESIIKAVPTLTHEAEDDLWLLAHLICLHKLKEGTAQESSYLRALSVLLSGSASEILARIDLQDDQRSESVPGDDRVFKNRQYLPDFISNELITLADKESVTGLLAKLNSNYITASATEGNGDASLLASYALILLRIFPKLSEEIRMWLYQGSVRVDETGVELPALQIFWRAMSTTRTFLAISHDQKSALSILRSGMKQRGPSGAGSDALQNHDWSIILLFLELYAFVLRFTDDEEFLSGGSPNLLEPGRPISRSRASALPLRDVGLLTMFLKNLSFVMYFNAAELFDNDQQSIQNGLQSYFVGRRPSGDSPITSRSGYLSSDSLNRVNEYQEFLGIAGMTFVYVRSMATRVMRMLYERDSRRRFLPSGHWLMTSRFDMEGFIPAVVMEEDRRRQIVEDGEETEEEEEEETLNQTYSSRQMPPIGMGRTRQHVFQENLRRQQQKVARERLLAAIGPRLEILQNMPFVIPFETRVQIFRQFVLQDQIRRRKGNVDPDQWRMSIVHHDDRERGVVREILGRHHAKIHRDRVLEDAYEQFYELGEGLKEPIQITFVDQFDTVEAGIDGGGVTKEFLTSITNEAFDGSSLFITNDQNLLYPNPIVLDQTREFLRDAGIKESSPRWKETVTEGLRHYEFLGRIIGKCLYEGILIDISFAGFFLLKWASTDGVGTSTQDSGYLTNINDLRDLDEALYQGLLQLKDYPGNVEDFSLDFTITDVISDDPPRTLTRELRPNGANIPVTNENRVLYISGVARHRLHGQSFHQTRAFLRGLGEIINPSWLSMFNQAELQTLIGGDSSEVDIDDLRRNTIYSGVYQIGDDGLEHPTIQLFWKVMKELDDSDRRKVLKYVTSTPRAPLLGFSQLNPRFSIRDAGADEQRLPSTSTCINLMKLPRYSSARTLREKLLYAVNSGAGFDLS